MSRTVDEIMRQAKRLSDAQRRELQSRLAKLSGAPRSKAAPRTKWLSRLPEAEQERILAETREVLDEIERDPDGGIPHDEVVRMLRSDSKPDERE